MQTSDDGRSLVEAFEGCMKAIGAGRFTTYYDSVHVLTLGFGHTNLGNVQPHINPGDIWTAAQCDQALSNDLAESDADVDRWVPGLTQCQHDALSSFQFNTGDLAKSSIPSRIKRGDITGAMATLLLYSHAGGQVLPGLVRRRHAERLMFLGEVEAALQLAGAHSEIAKNTTQSLMAKAELIPSLTELARNPDTILTA